MANFLLKNFRNIIGYEFTANLESDFDLIAEESKSWTGVVRNFYEPFHEQIELAKDISRDDFEIFQTSKSQFRKGFRLQNASLLSSSLWLQR